MGWYGTFLIPELKLIFHLRSVDENSLESSFESLDRFFSKQEKLRGDIEYVQNVTEESKSFSAKATAKMFNIIDELGYIPNISDNIFLLYFLRKKEFKMDCHSGEAIDFEKYEKKGWRIID